MLHAHPDLDLLMDYASGAAGEAMAVLVAAHLTFCPECRSTVRTCEAVGGALIEQDPPAQVARPVPNSQPPGVRKDERWVCDGVLPRVLAPYVRQSVDALPWSQSMFGYADLVLAIPGTAEAKLLRIRAGRSIPQHTHDGVEATLVLQGAYSDHTGTYARGDLVVVDGHVDHKPRAEGPVDCICLAVTVGQQRLTGKLGRVAGLLFGR